MAETPVSPSKIAAENAYRKRKGLPPLSEAEIAAMGGGAPPPAATAPAAASVPTAAPPAAAPPAAAPAAGFGEIIAEGKVWSASKFAAENAYRKRKGLPPLVAENAPAAPEAAASAATSPAAPAPAAAAASAPSGQVMVGGKPMSSSKLAAENAYRKKKGLPPLVPDAAPEATPAQVGASQAEKGAAAPAPAARAAMAAPVAAVPVDRTGAATRYVGTPAVGTSKAASAGGVAAVGPLATPADHRRRRFVWAMVVAFLGTWLLSFFRFFLPRALFEPSTTFKIGSASDFGLGVDTKFQQLYRIWVNKTPDRLFVIYARCTHLGCTPDWKLAENKFKCPCHGSGFDSEGINFEGPAPRPMDRAHVSIAPDGQILVNVGKLYSWPKGLPNQFNTYEENTNSGAYIRV